MPEITLVILAFKSFNDVGWVAYTIVFTCSIENKINGVKSGERGGQ